MIDRGFAYPWLLVAVAMSGAFGLSMVVTWFLEDTAHSLATGYGENAAFNTVFLLAVGVPLAASKPARAARA